MSNLVTFIKADNPKHKRAFDLNNIREFDLRTYGWIREQKPLPIKPEKKLEPVKKVDVIKETESGEIEIPVIPTPKKPGRKPATKTAAK